MHPTFRWSNAIPSLSITTCLVIFLLHLLHLGNMPLGMLVIIYSLMILTCECHYFFYRKTPDNNSCYYVWCNNGIILPDRSQYYFIISILHHNSFKLFTLNDNKGGTIQLAGLTYITCSYELLVFGDLSSSSFISL